MKNNFYFRKRPCVCYDENENETADGNDDESDDRAEKMRARSGGINVLPLSEEAMQ